MKLNAENNGENKPGKEKIINGDNRITNNDNRVNNTDRIEEDTPTVPIKENKKPSKMVLNKTTQKKIKGKSSNSRTK